MRRLAVLLCFAALAAVATPTPAPAASGAQTTLKASSAAPSLSIWRPAADGGYEHLQSGLSCPARFDGYRRTRVETFDGYGLDVGCTYSSSVAAITFYLTRRDGAALDAALDEAKRELLQGGAERHPRLLSETRAAEAGLTWTLVLYAEDGGNHSGIWIADLHGWTFEFRATYPAAEEAQILAEVKTVTAAIQASAGARLARCGVAVAPDRPGVRVTDPAKVESAAIMTSLMGSATAAAAAESGKAAAKPEPITWCVERAIAEPGLPLLFWRGVHDDGADAETDQITLVRDKGPIALDTAPEALASLVDSQKGEKAPVLWAASLQQERRVLIFGYFAGRPPAESLAGFFAEILTGKAKAVGAYGVHGGDITISMPSK